MTDINSNKTILFLAANPTNSRALRLSEEIRLIDKALRRATQRDRFKLEQKWAVRPRDMHEAVLDLKPQIVHFSGHGKGTETENDVSQTIRDIAADPCITSELEGLVFEDNAGQAKVVSTEAIASLFKMVENQVECVVLNTCYSEVQAEAISQHIPYVIGMNRAIGDSAARKFSSGFYYALGSGQDIDLAFESGCTAIRLESIREDLTPVLKQNEELISKLSQRSETHKTRNQILTPKDFEDESPKERLKKISTTKLSDILQDNSILVGYRATNRVLLDYSIFILFLIIFYLFFIINILLPLMIPFDHLWKIFPALGTFFSLCWFYCKLWDKFILALDNYRKKIIQTQIFPIEVILGYILETPKTEFLDREHKAVEYLFFILEDLQGKRYPIKVEKSKSVHLKVNDTGILFVTQVDRNNYLLKKDVWINNYSQYLASNELYLSVI